MTIDNFGDHSGESFGPIVTSMANSRVKHARALMQKKYRQKAREFLVEGEAMLRMGLQAGFKLAQAFVVADHVAGLDDLMRFGTLRPRDIVLTTGAIQASLAGRDNPQPVIAVFHQPARDLADHALAAGSLWLALQEPRDPGNLGTIIRTADAAGVDGIIILGGGCDPFANDSVRASMGSIFTVPVLAASLEAFQAWRLAADAPGMVAGLALEGSIPYSRADYAAPLVLMMGNESTGLPPHYRAACDKLLHIPMRGQAESLNLAVSTAIVLYHASHILGRFDGAKRQVSPLAFER